MREFTNRGEVDHRRLRHASASSAVMRLTLIRHRQHADASTATANFLDEKIADLGQRLGGFAGRRRARRD